MWSNRECAKAIQLEHVSNKQAELAMTNALAESQAPHACVISGMWLLRFMVNPREALKYGLKSLAIEI